MNFVKHFYKLINYKNSLILLSILYTIGICIKYLNGQFSPDSWTYYELSKNIFEDFYKINTYRQFQLNTSYGISFPPFHPFIIACINYIYDIGIYAGYFFNHLILILTLIIFSKISKKLFGYEVIGILIFLILILNIHYINEVVGARTIPLAILLFFTMFYFSLEKSFFYKFKYNFLLGILSGIMVLNRFDALLPTMMMGILIFVNKSNSKVIKNLLVYYITFFMCISPYIIYSMIHFNSFYISDNSRKAFLAFNNFVTDYFQREIILDNIFNEPYLWLVNLFSNRILSSLSEIYKNQTFLILISMILFLIIIFFKNKIKIVNLIKYNENHFNKFIVFLFWLLIQISTIFLTGYGDQRYFSLIMIFLIWFFVYLIIIIFRQYNKLTHNHLIDIERLVLYFVGLVIIFNLNFFVYLKNFAYGLKHTNLIELNENNLKTNEFSELINELNEYSKSPKVLIDPKFFLKEYSCNHYKFGALSGIITMGFPNNLNEKNILPFLNDYKVNFVYTDNIELINVISKKYSIMKNLNIDHLYEL